MQSVDDKNIQLSLGRAVILGVTSLLMSASVFMSVFSPYPLALASSFIGRKKGIILSLILLVISYFVSTVIFKSIFSFAVYALVTLISIMISEIIRLKISPVKGIFIGGLVLIGSISMASYSALSFKNLTLKQFVLNTIIENKEAFDLQKEELKKSGESAEVFETLTLLDQPNLFADAVIEKAPAYLVAGSFMIIWFNLFLLIRSQRFLLRTKSSAISEFSLMYIRLPDHLIWLVIISLAMVLVGDQFSTILPTIGSVLISALSVFYFFQGFGIYISFLNYVNVTGIFRTILIVFTMVTANYILVLIGLFDMFFNFRRFFIKK